VSLGARRVEHAQGIKHSRHAPFEVQRRGGTVNLAKRMELRLTRAVAHSPDWVYDLSRNVRSAFDIPYIRWKSASGVPFVLVYQQGRVASTSVYEGLCALDLGLPVFHVHTLSRARAEERIEQARREGRRVDRNLIVGRALSRELERHQADPDRAPWKVVSIFRDPIGVMMSIHFMHPTILRASTGHGGLDGDAALDHFRRIFENDDPAGWELSRWYDDVFAEETGVDVFAHPFDRDRGYSVIRAQGLDVLLIRFESLRECFSQAIGEWLEVSPSRVTLPHANIHREKSLDGLHDFAKKNLSLSREACERVYSTRFVRHFYSEAAIDALVEQWTRAAPSAVGE
jgi:hypothetical protein